MTITADHVVYFDTLAYANKLKRSGVPSEQAEVHAEALLEVFEDRIATKQDLKTETEKLHNEIAALRNEMNVRFTEVKVEMIRWMIGLLMTQSALLITVLKFLH